VDGFEFELEIRGEPAFVHRFATGVSRTAGCDAVDGLGAEVFLEALRALAVAATLALTATLAALAAAAMRSEIEQTHSQLELDIDPGIPNVEGDSLALEQAFRNLVANAVRHAAEGRWIGLSAKAQQNGVLILVRDRGRGIPRSEQRRIFEPFFRSDRTRTAGICGAGLGLSLARETARSHGGTLTVRSEPGQGAEFSFWLPAAPEPA
jgi:signal transduction histidine kinase